MSMIRKLTDNTALSSGMLDDWINFILSDGSIDAYDDIIDQDGWELPDYLIALFNHDLNFPIGRWHDLAVTKGKLHGRLELAPKGTSQRIDEVAMLVKAGVLRGASVGFVPLESEPRAGSRKGGTRYKKQILRECSVVSIPANSNAVMLQAKALGVSDATIKTVLSQTVNATLGERQERARLSIQRAKAAIRRADAITGRNSVAAKREQLMEAARAKLRAKVADDPFSLRGLTDAEQKAVLRAKQEAPYAVPQSDNPWQEPPELFFNGKPIYPKKGPYGY